VNNPINQFANAVVIHEDGQRVLLYKREDFRIWALPGGNIEAGETPDQAAVREVFEETGYHVEIDSLVGVYQRPQLNDERYVYRAFLIGGKPIDRGPETVAVAWFYPEKFPTGLAPSVAEIVTDAFANHGEILTKEQFYPPWKIKTFQSLRWLRDKRNQFMGRK
jgi:8-oxo-dGTP diphosphatase